MMTVIISCVIKSALGIGITAHNSPPVCLSVYRLCLLKLTEVSRQHVLLVSYCFLSFIASYLSLVDHFHELLRFLLCMILYTANFTQVSAITLVLDY